MPITLSDTIRERLKEPGQTRVTLVRAMGYRNLTKGLRLLDGLLLRERTPEGDQPDRLAQALALELSTVLALCLADRALAAEQERLSRARDPRYRLTMRLMAAVYCQEQLSGALGLGDALEHAAALARERRRPCCLNAPSNLSYWLTEEGTLAKVTNGGEPYMQMGNHRFIFSCST